MRERSSKVTPLTSRLPLFVEHIAARDWREADGVTDAKNAKAAKAAKNGNDAKDAQDATRDRFVAAFEQRQKARQRVRLESGREVGLRLPRGTVLRGGDKLRATDGTVVDVVAAPEDVSTVVTADLSRLARLAYHLGNRHVALEVGDGWVRYLRDHVLDAMVAGLGGSVVHERAPFEPESGAYGGHRHAHPHDADGRLDDRGQSVGHRRHRHDQDHHHDHDHEHD